MDVGQRATAIIPGANLPSTSYHRETAGESPTLCLPRHQFDSCVRGNTLEMTGEGVLSNMAERDHPEDLLDDLLYPSTEGSSPACSAASIGTSDPNSPQDVVPSCAVQRVPSVGPTGSVGEWLVSLPPLLGGPAVKPVREARGKTPLFLPSTSDEGETPGDSRMDEDPGAPASDEEVSVQYPSPASDEERAFDVSYTHGISRSGWCLSGRTIAVHVRWVICPVSSTMARRGGAGDVCKRAFVAVTGRWQRYPNAYPPQKPSISPRRLEAAAIELGTIDGLEVIVYPAGFRAEEYPAGLETALKTIRATPCTPCVNTGVLCLQSHEAMWGWISRPATAASTLTFSPVPAGSHVTADIPLGRSQAPSAQSALEGRVERVEAEMAELVKRQEGLAGTMIEIEQSQQRIEDMLQRLCGQLLRDEVLR
ncbi:hypothetical protein L226DRAFT_574989 [Lentinus tigrinus ALCF2SS1-7]|uniref:uncharacterized protein n=1 Tax=Lentinus tigrinus ALCF2SS1-7 TaxID=1328758 RepID=UPI00116632E5|nr:hypothetical protein L226DRAFT_574989 [Lentinus tigrinus ALCF2SS1-7]